MACEYTLNNSGTPSCFPIISLTHSLMVQPTFDSTGVKNFIDVSGTVNNATFKAMINNTDGTKRLYPLPELKNIEDVRDEAITFNWDDNETVYIQDGVRKFKGFFPLASTTFLSQISDYRNTDLGVYFRSVEEDLIANSSVAGKMYPVRIAKGTWRTTYIKSKTGEPVMIQLDFDFAKSEKDEDLNVLTSGEMDSDTNLLDLSGLLDVNGVSSSITTTTFTLTASMLYGSAKTKQAFSGGVIGDFSLYNVTSSVAVVLTTVTEGSDGVYAIVMPLQTTAHVLTLSMSKDGFEMDDVTVIIP